MTTSRLSLAVVISAAALLACSGGGVNPSNFLKPQVDLRRIGLRSLGLSGGTLDVELGIANPNHLRLTGTQLTAGLDLQGNHFGDIATSDSFAITEADTTVLTVPLSFSWLGVGSAAKAVLDRGEVTYKLNGTLSVLAPAIGSVSVPFDREGSVPVSRVLSKP